MSDDDNRDLLPAATPERLMIPVTFDMMKAARLLRRRLPHEQYNRLFESIVQLASDDLEVESTLSDDDAAERQPSLFPPDEPVDKGGGDAESGEQ